MRVFALTLLEPQSRSGDKPVKFQVVLSPNGIAVLKGLKQSFFKTVSLRDSSILGMIQALWSQNYATEIHVVMQRAEQTRQWMPSHDRTGYDRYDIKHSVKDRKQGKRKGEPTKSRKEEKKSVVPLRTAVANTKRAITGDHS